MEMRNMQKVTPRNKLFVLRVGRARTKTIIATTIIIRYIVYE